MEGEVISVDTLTVSNNEYTKTVLLDVLLKFVLVVFSEMTRN